MHKLLHVISTATLLITLCSAATDRTCRQRFFLFFTVTRGLYDPERVVGWMGKDLVLDTSGSKTTFLM